MYGNEILQNEVKRDPTRFEKEIYEKTKELLKTPEFWIQAKQSDLWKVICDAIYLYVEKEKEEEIANCKSNDWQQDYLNIVFRRGYIKGLKYIMQIPDLFLSKHKEKQQKEEMEKHGTDGQQ